MGGSRKRAASADGLDDPSVQTEGAKQDNYEMLFGRVDPDTYLRAAAGGKVSKRN